MRIVFTISGKRVQGIGYRLFLLSLMKEKGIVGLPLWPMQLHEL